jgi:hypothetical protein
MIILIGYQKIVKDTTTRRTRRRTRRRTSKPVPKEYTHKKATRKWLTRSKRRTDSGFYVE